MYERLSVALDKRVHPGVKRATVFLSNARLSEPESSLLAEPVEHNLIANLIAYLEANLDSRKLQRENQAAVLHFPEALWCFWITGSRASVCGLK